MPATSAAQQAPAFAAWRVVTWLLLLLAAFGCAQYLRHASLMRTQLQLLAPGSGEAASALQRMLVWDMVYLLAALVFIVLCAACILRQGWARRPLRVASCLLAFWVAATGVMLLLQWWQFDRASTEALVQLRADPVLQLAVQHARRSYLLALAFKLVAVPLLLWLAWRLGAPSVRGQFRVRAERPRARSA
jgi:hypothetical protein